MRREHTDYRFTGVELDGNPVSIRECKSLGLKREGRKVTPYEAPKSILVDRAVNDDAFSMYSKSCDEGLERCGLLIGTRKNGNLRITGIRDNSKEAKERSTLSVCYQDEFRRELILNSRDAYYDGGRIVGQVHTHFGENSPSFTDQEFFERSPSTVFAILDGRALNIHRGQGISFTINLYQCEPIIGSQKKIGSVEFEKKMSDARAEKLGYWRPIADALRWAVNNDGDGLDTECELYRKLILSGSSKDIKKADKLRDKYEEMVCIGLCD